MSEFTNFNSYAGSQYLTNLRPTLFSYKNQSIPLQRKSIGWFLQYWNNCG